VRPDINKSVKNFTYTGGKIYFGLLAIKNAGSGLADRIITERQMHGPFTGLQDFCERLEGRELNKKALENLIKAGAFDEMGLNRRQMLENYEMIMDAVISGSRGVIDGQLNLLDSGGEIDMGIRIPYAVEYDKRELLAMEKDAAGMYLTGDPLSDHSHIVSLLRTKTVKEILSLEKLRDGDEIKLLCTVQDKKMHMTRKNERMCFITVSDGSGELEAVVFPDLFAVSATRLTVGNIVLISGKISVKDDSVTVVCGSVISEKEFPRYTENMKLCIKLSSDSGLLEGIKDICRKYRGNTSVCFYFTDMRKMLVPKEKLAVGISAELFAGLSDIIGSSNIGLIA